jgi:thiol-disulfide isomerase/thioredoxin
LNRLLAIIGAAALLAGCAAPVVSTPSTPSTPAGLPARTVAASPSAGGPAVVPAALHFTGRTLDGASFDAATMAGRPTILWFWAPWCATCASEAQSIADLANEYHGQLGILGVAGLGTNKAMHEFVADLNVGNVPHLDDQAGAIWKKFKITQQSTYVFLDRSGRVVKTGYLDDLQLTAEVRTLVA